jgi:hypothetical protein
MLLLVVISAVGVVRPFTNGTTGPLTITPQAKFREEVIVVTPAESCSVLPLPQEFIAFCKVVWEGFGGSVWHTLALGGAGFVGGFEGEVMVSDACAVVDE